VFIISELISIHQLPSPPREMYKKGGVREFSASAADLKNNNAHFKAAFPLRAFLHHSNFLSQKSC